MSPILNVQLALKPAAISCQYFPQQQPFYDPLPGTTLVSWYQKKHSPTHTNPDHQPSFISFLHLLRSIASLLFNLRAWQSFCRTYLQVLFGQPLGLAPSTHTPYISSPNHCLLFTRHAHSIATCFAVVQVQDNPQNNTASLHWCYFCTLARWEMVSPIQCIACMKYGSRTPHSHVIMMQLHTHTHNRFTAGVEYVRVHPGQQVPER